MFIRSMNMDTDYKEVLKLLQKKGVKKHAVLFEDSETMIAVGKDTLLGMATLRFIRTLPILQHFIINANNLIAGRVFHGLIKKIEEDVIILGFDKFVIDADKKRLKANNIIIKYFKKRILCIKHENNKILYLVRI